MVYWMLGSLVFCHKPIHVLAREWTDRRAAIGLLHTRGGGGGGGAHLEGVVLRAAGDGHPQVVQKGSLLVGPPVACHGGVVLGQLHVAGAAPLPAAHIQLADGPRLQLLRLRQLLPKAQVHLP